VLVHLVPGDQFDGYTVRAHLGSGGSSEVYKVFNSVADRLEALKILDADAANPVAARERFNREFEIAKSLDHPNIVQMYRNGEFGTGALGPDQSRSTLWMTMQYVEGTSAQTLIPAAHDEPHLSVIRGVLAQIAGALDYAHSMDVLHRDVKPSNVLIGHSSTLEALLADFGIARFLDDARPVAQNGRVLGSLPYAAPEMLQGQQLSPATDEYSFACTVVELLTGRPPYPLATAFAIVHAHIAATPPSVSSRRSWIPPAIDAILSRALAKDPAQRYESCSELADLMGNVLAEVSIPVTRPRRGRWGRARSRRG
jgi:serine/threonine-protein kinase